MTISIPVMRKANRSMRITHSVVVAGRAATGVKDEDHVEHLLVANSHTTLLLFSSKGKVYWKRTFEIPEASRASRGRPIVNLLPLEEGEKITAMLPVNEYTEDYFIYGHSKRHG